MNGADHYSRNCGKVLRGGKSQFVVISPPKAMISVKDLSTLLAPWLGAIPNQLRPHGRGPKRIRMGVLVIMSGIY